MREWIAGIIIFIGFVMTTVAAYCTILLWLVFNIPLLYTAKLFILYGPSLFLSGIWVGLMGLTLIIAFGKSGGEFAFIAAWGFGPLVGVFYPVEMFPSWLQQISNLFPMTYIFKSMRSFILHNDLSFHYIYMSYALNAVYLCLMGIVFYYAFVRAKKHGLIKLLQ
jgi:ABC-2 type transport system permease protein